VVPVDDGSSAAAAAKAKMLAGKFVNSMKSKQKDKKDKKVQSLLAKRAMSYGARSSAAGSNEGMPTRPSAMGDDVWEEVCAQLGICADGTDLDADGMNVPADRWRKKKKKKRKRSKRSKGSSYSSSSYSSRSSSDFRLPTSKAAGRENAIAECARRSPGKLFTQGLRTMQTFCDPMGSRGGEQLPATAYRYLTTLVSAAQGMNLGKRDHRELQTLAICLDQLAKGNTAGVGDVLIQRFKAVENSASHKSWDLAKHMEIVPEQQFATASIREQEAAAKMTIRDSQLQRSLKASRDESRYQRGGQQG